jgi:multidrug efflux system membrane fusion protein
VILGGCKEKAPPRAVEAPKVTVMPLEKRELIHEEEFNGWLEPDETVEVRARARGHIRKVCFEDGQVVIGPFNLALSLPNLSGGLGDVVNLAMTSMRVPGQVLFELDPRPLQNNIDIAKDKLNVAKDKVNVYDSQRIAAEKEVVRLKALKESVGGASQQQIEKAEADVGSLKSQISAAQNDVSRAENEVDRAELDFDYSLVRAEITGRVGAARLTVGNLVNAGGTDPILTTIVDEQPIRVYFNVDERSLRRYAESRGVKEKSLRDLLADLKSMKTSFTFALDGETENAEKKFPNQGVLAFADNRIDTSTGTLQFYGTAGNEAGSLTPGARVRVRLPIGRPYDALLVPETAILADQDKRYVLIVDEKKNALRRNIRPGALTDDGMRAIEPEDRIEGEKIENWQVIVDNLQRVRINYSVNPQNSPSR